MPTPNTGSKMLKLYKQIDGAFHYTEAWRNGGEVTLHWGRVGDRGKSETYLIDGELTSEPAVENVLKDAYADGCKEIELDDHVQVIVQYRTESWGSPEDLDKRHRVENVLNECLGWTGNGHCDGGDIGSGSINAYSFVVDTGRAKETIVDALRSARLLDGAIIAVEKDGDYDVVWPESYDGDFSPI